MRRVNAALCWLAIAVGSAISAYAQHAATGGSGANRAQAGQLLFQQHCAVCHSILPGATLVGPSLYGMMKVPAPAKAALQARSIILNGKGKMPGQKAQFSSADVDNLLAYLKTL